MTFLDYLLFAVGIVLIIVWYDNYRKVDQEIAKYRKLLAELGAFDEKLGTKAIKDLRWAQDLSKVALAAGILGALMIVHSVRSL